MGMDIDGGGKKKDLEMTEKEVRVFERMEKAMKMAKKLHGRESYHFPDSYDRAMAIVALKLFDELAPPADPKG